MSDSKGPSSELTVSKLAVDKIAQTVKEKLPQSEIIPTLQKMANGTSNFSVARFESLVNPIRNAPDGKTIAPKDGQIKIKIAMEFLKQTNKNIDIFKNNSIELQKLSLKYDSDPTGFANAFYNFFTTKKGYADIAPKLEIIELDIANIKSLGLFSTFGVIQVSICPEAVQTNIVNTIAHELSHFEDFIMTAKTVDIGMSDEANERILNAFIMNNGGYDKFFDSAISPQELTDFGYRLIKNQPSYKKMLKEAIEQLTTDFFRKIVASDIMPPITKDSPNYEMAHELSKSILTKFRPGDLYTYRKTLHERKAHHIGESTAAAFDKIIETNQLTDQMIKEAALEKA